MNNKIAISLIIGSLFAVAIGLHTAETKYYQIGSENREIPKEWYESNRYRERSRIEKTYNPMFMTFGFFGGLGAGYLAVSVLEAGISLIKRRAKKPVKIGRDIKYHRPKYVNEKNTM